MIGSKGQSLNEQDLKDLMQSEAYTSDEELAVGGFSVIDRTDGGMVAHRGTLHPDEYVDSATLREAAEASLGFTYEEISSVYRQGPLAPEQRQLRERIDARLLALSRAGGAMATLASVLKLNEKTVDRALARARDVEISPIVAKPVVTHSLPCFKCEQDARPRKRRFSKSPRVDIGTINLCDEHYAAGWIVIRTNSGPRAVKRPVNAVGLIRDRDARTFGGHRHYGPPWVPARQR